MSFRNRQSGLLEPPPAMVKAVTEWAQTAGAYKARQNLASQIKDLQDISGKIYWGFHYLGRLREEVGGSLKSIQVWVDRVKAEIPKVKGAPSASDFKTLPQSEIVEKVLSWADRIEVYLKELQPDQVKIRKLQQDLDQLSVYPPPVGHSVRKFPVDLTGWKYAAGVDVPGWDFITVVLEFGPVSHVGWWVSSNKSLTLAIPPNATLEFVEHDLPSTVAHEMQHTAQDLLKALGKGEGLPSRKIQTPSYHQKGTGLTHPGLAVVERAKHDLDDVEFFPMLDTAIREIRKQVARNPQRGREVILYLILAGPKPKGLQIKPLDTFATWKGTAPGKWRRAVKEVFRAFPVLSESSATRVATAWRVASAHSVAENLLFDAPDSTIDELIADVQRARSTGIYDSDARKMVDADDVIRSLEAMKPAPIHVTNGITVYHATTPDFAKVFLKRGHIPEGKVYSRSDSYSPGHGLDRGMYVGATPQAVESYGRVTLAVTVPRDMLLVPTELKQMGETDALRALRSHDGALIVGRVPSTAFSVVEGHKYLH